AISSVLARDLQNKPRARLLLSGGSTPRPVYEALSKAPLEWDRVDVALVDERWLLPDDPDSNSRLVRESLLRNNAARARFESITRPGRSIEEAVNAANLHAKAPPGVVVLGMGEDGHTASLFPRMQNLEASLEARSACVAVDAPGCPGARKVPRPIRRPPAGIGPVYPLPLLTRRRQVPAPHQPHPGRTRTGPYPPAADPRREQAQAARTRARRGRSAGVPGAHRIPDPGRAAARPLVPVTARSRGHRHAPSP